jgi:putative transposase
VWTADVKGQLKAGDGLYGSPLTVADGFSRCLLGGQALASTRVPEATPRSVRRFKDFGWPTRLRTGNGVPCATNALARRSQLSAGWVRLGIRPDFIEPGQPPHNGRHERRHRTLTAEPTRPPAKPRRAQQDKVDRCRQECNAEPPHEALDMQPPAARYAASPRQLPSNLPPLEDPDRFGVRYVSANGGLRGNRQWGNVSIGWAGEDVGLEEIDDGVWHVSCGPLKLGRLLERHRRIEAAYGRLTRHR